MSYNLDHSRLKMSNHGICYRYMKTPNVSLNVMFDIGTGSLCKLRIRSSDCIETYLKHNWSVDPFALSSDFSPTRRPYNGHTQYVQFASPTSDVTPPQKQVDRKSYQNGANQKLDTQIRR